jgi:hypothetical protein
MSREYSRIGSTIQPYALPDDVLLAMGRLIRAFAEIEDIITLHLCSVADISEGQAVLLLGRLAMSKKLTMAYTFAAARGGDNKARLDGCFDNDEYKACLKARNVAAHGLLLGLTEEGKIAFRTVETTSASLDAVGLEAISFELEAFEIYAGMAENAIPQIEDRLGVQALREERRLRDLGGHPKAQPTRPPSEPRQRQRKPPPVKRKDKALKNRG